MTHLNNLYKNTIIVQVDEIFCKVRNDVIILLSDHIYILLVAVILTCFISYLLAVDMCDGGNHHSSPRHKE